MKEYAVTVKIQKTDRMYLACDYDSVLKTLMDKQSSNGCDMEVVESIYELDSMGKLHYHGIWKCTKGVPNYRRFNCKGCTAVMKEVYYRSGWTNYIKKQQIMDRFNIKVGSEASEPQIRSSSLVPDTPVSRSAEPGCPCELRGLIKV